MHFLVDKIPCAGCATAVENKIREEYPAGVLLVSVDIMLKRMKITIEEDFEDEITTEGIIQAVEEIGKE